MEQTTTQTMTEVFDITNTYKVKGNLFTRKQRVSSFLTKHPEGTYVIHTREGQSKVTNGQVVEGNVPVKSLVDKAFKLD